MATLDPQIVGIINQHRNAILALEAVIASLSKQTAIEPETIKKNVRGSRIFGELSPETIASAEKIALRIASQI